MRRLSVVFALLLLGCPPAEKKDKPATEAPCSKIGQACEFSPGKLGTCVQSDTCATSAPCFVCQSQH